MDVTLRLNDLVEEFDGDARKALLAALAKIDILQSRLAHLREQNAWHPASELPKNSGQLYLVVLDVGVVDTAIYLESDGWLMSYPVVLWHELPAPPDITSDLP